MSTTNRLTIGAIPGGAGAPPAEDAAQRQQVAIAAREFEAMFLRQMLQQMRSSMLSEEVQEEGLGASTMTDTMDGQLARHLAGQSGGLYDVLVQAFSKQLGGAAVPSATLTPSGGGLPAEPMSLLALPEGRVSSQFGWRTDPLTGGNRFHKGVDFAAAYGTDVPSAGQGRVVFAGEQGGYGQTVVIQHAGGVQTRYAHLSHIGVTAGESVEAGAIVGRVGSSGRSTGAHLHFEVLEDGRPVDPARAEAFTTGLKVKPPIADYPRGTARAVVSPEE